MKKGLLSTVLICISVSPVQAQTLSAPPVVSHDVAATWQPPNTACMDCPDIGPKGYRFYGSAEFLLWWSKGDQGIVPFIGERGESEGRGSFPGLTNTDPLCHPGARVMLGAWLNHHQCCGLEVAGFWLGERSHSLEFNNDEIPGSAFSSQFRSRAWGTEANLRSELCRGTWAHLDFLTGVRYLQLNETLNLSGGNFEEEIAVSYDFSTRNRFLGGQLGAETVLHRDNWFIDIWGKIALGENWERFGISGTIFDGEVPSGGNVSGQESLGEHHRREFAVVPEVGFNIGCQMSEHCRFTVGYTWVYFSDVIRPGAQVNSLLQGPFSDGIQLRTSSFWLQGVSTGIEFRF